MLYSYHCHEFKISFLFLGTFIPPEADSNLTIEDFERSYEEVMDVSISAHLTLDLIYAILVFLYLLCFCIYRMKPLV